MSAPKPRHRSLFHRQLNCAANLPDIKVPPDLEPVTLGPWVLDQVPPITFRDGVGYIPQRGYWSGFAPEKVFWRLRRDGEVWMTTSKMERESHAVHLKHATGVVVVAGVGLGMFLYNVIRKPDVKFVVAIEKDSRLMRWCQARSRKWAFAEKIGWINGDALAVDRTILSQKFGIQEPPHYLYADIWSKLDDEHSVADVGKMQANLWPRTISWWTQELSFIRWCARNNIPPSALNLDVFDRWCIAMDMVIPERSLGYVGYCLEVAHNTTLR